MSQDITLAQNRNLPVRPEDVWGGGQSTGSSLGMYSPQARQQQPFKKIHRLLRGRYWLAITLGLIGAAVGAFIGWGTQIPFYSAEALIEISPRMPSLSAADRAMPFYQQFLKSQQQIVVNSRTISAALETSEWKAVSSKPASKEFISAFAANLNADLIKDSQLIRVTFQHESPRVAAAAVNAVVTAYLKLADEMNSQSSKEKLDEYQRRLEQAKIDFRRNGDSMRDAQGENTVDSLENIISERQKQEMKYTMDVANLQMKLDQLQASQAAGVKNPNIAITPQDVALQDATMRIMLEAIARLQGELTNLQIDLGPNHPRVQQTVARMQAQQKAADDYFKQSKERILGFGAGSGQGGEEVISARVAEMYKINLELLKKQLVTWQTETQQFSKRKIEVDRYRDEMSKNKEDTDKYTKLIEQVEFNMAMSGNIRKISDAVEPISPAKDARKQFAMMGLVIGGGLPIGLLLLIGLLDSRYRYSDDAGGISMNGLPLLGILPNLPDRLSDPGQASIAAHCVHQIRTMLQLNNATPRSAFSVTSSASGDGKTSLTLALGLSFAASGQRTLLIDSDLVGAGLTTRLGMSGPEGILEAMTSGELMRYVKATDVADLSMLPVGLAQLHHAGIFSPAAVRRLLNEAKKHFEVILVDTGPVLGSIEATPVCAAADGVILTVARGQQRPLVEKALGHLQSIGARIAGIVFNKAMSRDFEQSISGISMRSAARSTSTNGNGRTQREGPGQYGPVAKAVHHSVKGETVEKN